MCKIPSHLLCPTLCPSHQGLVKSGVYVPPTLVSYTREREDNMNLHAETYTLACISFYFFSLLEITSTFHMLQGNTQAIFFTKHGKGRDQAWINKSV